MPAIVAMKFKHVYFIINPASGKEEPILSYINRVLDGSGIEWDVAITKKNKSAGDIARELIGKTDLIAVYGGDGCVTEVAAALHGTKMPMAIISGGTANVMAKELGIPLDTESAIEVLIGEGGTLRSIDMGLLDDQPFVLRINMGIMADMVLQADRSLKENMGQLAYGITAVKTIGNAEPLLYKMEIDGQLFEETAVSLTVTNSGHIGIGDFSLQPGISITDGLLDVVLLKDAGLVSLLKVAGSTLLHTETEAVMHWQCKRIVITMPETQNFICDDREVSAKKISIEVVPSSIQILVPVKTS
ncbi:diacylglycerol/lipid kinase family protein [Pedobacter metabolipauper]|uniref:YegS/Rv2252/BmrU family lipid kinase n=1 Tax=Pedobacter metabolipauper TaxID=425513 RepID=A0A4R6SV65_9SPHI|nr:diacylglycerol kinase family protein [Pedobacter metabolipauper]TDQ09216.1 YegS/Rv2252/BmrU family lipid kinase [Pedobacter metabolipauper]